MSCFFRKEKKNYPKKKQQQMASAVGVFIDFLVSVFAFLVNSIINILCGMIFLFTSVFVPWRLMFSIPLLLKSPNQAKFREQCMGQVLVSVFQLLGLVCFVFTLLTWRGCIMVSKFFASTEVDHHLDWYSKRPQVVIWFVLALTD